MKRPVVQCIRLDLRVIEGHVTLFFRPVPFPPWKVVMPLRTRTKALAKSNEEQDIARLIDILNGPSGELHRLYNKAFPGQEIVGARASDPADKKKAGGRSAHYDFQILVRTLEEEKWIRVEHKGSQGCKPINEEQPPWTGGVQFFNGGMEKYRLCHRYAEEWYARYIGSGFLSQEYEIKEAIPSCEEWIKRDARVQGDPKTAWGVALKRAVRRRGQESLRDLRDAFVPNFVAGLSTEDHDAFLEDVTPILRASLGQKEVWLQIAGNIEQTYHARWSPALVLGDVIDVQILGEKDVTGCISSDCAHPIRFILRWGKGAGFSNLRLDLK